MPEAEGDSRRTTRDAATPERRAAPPPDDANDLRGYHFKLLLGSRLTWALILGAVARRSAVVAAVFVGAAGRRRRPRRPRPASALADRLRRRRLAAPPTPSSPSTPAARPRARRQGAAAADDAAAAQGRRPLRRAHPEPASSPPARRHPRPLHLRGRAHRQRRQPRDQLLPLHRRPGPRSPSAPRFVPELYCQRKFGLRALEKFEDVFRGSKERVKLESEALDRQVRDLRRQGPGRRSGCAASSPPPSSSG